MTHHPEHDHPHGHHHHDHGHHHHHHLAPPTDEGWLVIDVGAGTQDILLYEPGRPLEASHKLVLPAPCRIAAQKVRQARQAGRNVWLYGSLMGGGDLTEAVREHVAAGLKVYSQTQPALSLFDDLRRVEALGVVLTEAKPAETTPVPCGDVDLRGLAHALEHFGLSLPGRSAACAQDHGFNPAGSARELRFQTWAHFLDHGGHLADLIYTQPPAHLTRLLALTQALPGAVVADSASAALLGALLDEDAQAHLGQGVTVVNVGNGHTVAFLVQGRPGHAHVQGVYEHHTGLLTREKLVDHLARFRAGTLTNQEVLDGQGHGCKVLAPGEYQATVITGPRRALAEGLGRMAVVHGDMMLTGCFGLLEGARLSGALG